MQPIYAIILYGCLMVGVYLVVDAIAGFLRRAGGADDEAVVRRLSTQAGVRIQSGAHVNVIRPKGGLSEAWQEYIPFYPRFLRLLDTSGTGMTIQRGLGIMAGISLVAFVLLAFIIPLRFFPLSIPFAPVIGIGSVI